MSDCFVDFSVQFWLSQRPSCHLGTSRVYKTMLTEWKKPECLLLLKASLQSLKLVLRGANEAGNNQYVVHDQTNKQNKKKMIKKEKKRKRKKKTSKKGKESISLQTPRLARSLNNSFVQCWTRCSLNVILFLWFVFGRVENRLDTDDRFDQV